MKNEREKSDFSNVAKRPANKPKVSEVDLWAAGRSRRSQGKGQSLRKQGADLTGGLWALRGNEWTRSQEHLDLRRKLGRAYPILAAPSPCARPSKGVWPMAICFPSAGSWAGPDRSRLEPFRKLSRTLKEHFQGILAYLETRLTNAAIDAVTGLLQMAKRVARGFRNFHYFRIAAYLKASRLHLQPQDITPMKYHWTDGSEFRMSKFLQIKLHLACATRGAHIGFHIVGMLRTIFASC